MLHDTIELLERSWQFLDSQPGFDFVAHAFAFFEDLQRDPRTRAILDDLLREERASVVEVQQAVGAARAALLRILDELERTHGETFPEPDEVFDCSANGLRRKLALVEDGDDEDDVRVGELQSDGRASQVVEILLRQAGSAGLEQIQGSLETVKRQLAHAQRRRRLTWTASAGASVALMLQRLLTCTPAPSH